jgi:hypothetical protein
MRQGNHASAAAGKQKPSSQIASFRDPEAAIPAKTITSIARKTAATSDPIALFTDDQRRSPVDRFEAK